MITIKINGKQADIFPDMKIQFKMDNPLFSENFINEGYTYSFSLPLTPRNQNLIVKEKTSFDIYFKGILLEKTVIISHLKNIKSIDVNAMTLGKDFIKNTEDIELKELDFETVRIYDESDSVIDKSNAWSAFLVANLDEPSKEGKFKFPSIQTKGYIENFDDPLQNDIFFNCGNWINRPYSEYVSISFPVPISEGKQWSDTLAPCPKVNYILALILKKFNLRVRINELEGIPEFDDMVIFNNFVLDKLEQYSSSYYNVFSSEINLANHITDANIYAFLQMLNETFDCYFIIENNQIDILLSKNKVNTGSKNMTKFASEDFSNDFIESVGNNFTYEIDDANLKYYKILISNQEDPSDLENYEFLKPNETNSFPSSKITNNENPFASLPFITQIQFNGYGAPISHNQYLDLVGENIPEVNVSQYGRYVSSAFSPFLIKSDEYPENGAEIFTKIQTLCYRGRFETLQPGYNPDGSPNPILETLPLHNFVYNFKESYYLYEEVLPNSFPKYVFGKSSLYINGPDNVINSYKKPKLQILYKSTTKTKVLYLPLFELQELLKWKKPKHVIQQKKESFKGFVKNVSFVASNKGLSATTIEYIVPNTDLKGEFNDDFNNDFNT